MYPEGGGEENDHVAKLRGKIAGSDKPRTEPFGYIRLNWAAELWGMNARVSLAGRRAAYFEMSQESGWAANGDDVSH